MKSVIKHKAFVREVEGNTMKVSILNQSACSSCHANGACSMADMKEKEVEICNITRSYNPGEEVTVVFQETMGIKALLYGYVFPFVVVFFTLILGSFLTRNEALSGLLSLAVLVPYYLVLHSFRHHFKKIFRFEIEERG